MHTVLSHMKVLSFAHPVTGNSNAPQFWFDNMIGCCCGHLFRDLSRSTVFEMGVAKGICNFFKSVRSISFDKQAVPTGAHSPEQLKKFSGHVLTVLSMKLGGRFVHAS